MAIVGAAGIVLVALAGLAFTMRGGDGAAATADGASGPPLTAQQYATEMQSIAKAAEAGTSGDLDLDTMTPAQVEAALVPLREGLARGKALSPPAHVKVQHDALFAQLDQAVVQVEALATNPDDEAAMMSLMASAFAAAATMQQLEQQLGVDLDGEPAASAAAAPTG